MTWLSLGSMALPHALQRHGVQLRNDLSRLTLEMSSGEASNPARRLAGDLSALAAVEARSQRVATALDVARQALTLAEASQNVLARITHSASDMSTRLLAASTAGIDDAAVLSAGRAARGALEDTVAALGGQVVGRSLFAGTAFDRPPLVSVEAMLSSLVPSLAGATNAEDVASVVDAAFLDSGGLFETGFYLGAAGAAVVIDGSTLPDALPDALDPAIRRTLAGLVKAALVAEAIPDLSPGQRQALAQNSAMTLSDAEGHLTTLRATLGNSEARIDTAITRLLGERDALTLARDTLVGVDAYETATRLKETQTRLEMIYAITARTARLSLTEYL